jgi:inorganic pyrophosphatase
MMEKALIEVAAGSENRNHYNEKTLEFIEERKGSHPYPYPYGFILNTYGNDGEGIDCYILTDTAIQAGETVECVPIGMLEQFENDELDHKVLAVLPDESVALTAQIHERIRDFIYTIFSEYPEVQIRVGEILSKQKAEEHIYLNKV